MGFGTTFATLAFLFVFAGMSVVVINMQTSITAAATEVKAQQQELQKAQQQAINVESTSYTENDLRTWRQTYNDEFATGEFTNTTTTSDQVELAASNTTGTYTSQAYDTGFTSNYTTISWSSVEPSTSSITFQLRSANTTTQLETQPFIGPDATTNTVYDTPGATIHASHDQDQIIQYQATLQTSGASPQLQETSIGVRREVGHATITLQNTGSAKLHPQRTDAYVNGIRTHRTDSQRVLQLEIGLDERLWNPGQELTLTVFTNIDTSKSFTIINEHAQTSTTVTN